MATVRLSSQAERSLRRLPAVYARAVAAALRELAEDPLAGKPLRGRLRGLRSRRVGMYRIIYRFEPKERLVVVASLEHGGAAYRS